MKRNHIANFLGISLILLTVSLSVAGFITYNNLTEVVVKLDSDELSHANIIHYKELLVDLNSIESKVESFELTGKKNYLEQYQRLLENTLSKIDSLKSLNATDVELQVFNDSLKSLIVKKSEILNEIIVLGEVKKDEKLEAYDDLLKEINARSKNGGDIASAAIIETKSNTFLKRLFSRKSRLEASLQSSLDSLVDIRNDDNSEKLVEKVDELMATRAIQENLQNQKEMLLLEQHFDIQNQIVDLISYLESRETVKIQIKSLNARHLAAKTNKQIFIFVSLSLLMLISCIIIMVIYFNRNTRYNALLRESKKSSEIVSQAKERFFANMSHELRTPMNAISGFTKILLKSPLNEEQNEQVTIIDKSSQHLLSLLNDILDFSKLQADKLLLEIAPFDITLTCKECIQFLEEQAKSKGLKLIQEIEPLPQFIVGDPSRFRQILLNILSNAIKYTEKGFVKMTVSGKEVQNTLKLTVVIEDTGEGIAPENQIKMFQEFEQANQSSFSKGTGLGLAITRRLVNLHNGSMKFDSEVGKGTKVTISLKYKVSDHAPEELELKPEKLRASLIGMKALIADDEPFNVKLLATLLRKKGMEIKEAIDGEKALQMALDETFDIILLDLKMPQLSGWEVAEKISKTEGPNQNTPMIALTATASKLDHENEQTHGFKSVMRKPFDEVLLFDKIEKYLNVEPEESKEIKKQEEVVTENISIDLTSLQAMGSDEFVADMIETFIASANSAIRTLKQAIKNDDFEVLSMTAHKIVTPARHFHANELVDKLKQLEKRADRKDKSLSNAEILKIESLIIAVSMALRESLLDISTPKNNS
ncbi:MAG: signal transduction histidine kinase/DNA-binding response OmpR family regulator [Marinoscillum sp.]